MLVALAAAVPPLLLRRRGLAWSLPAAAPLLGLAGLAGAYPAVAGAVRGPWARAALGAAGLWWLLLAEPLLGRDLALGTPPGDAGTVLEALGSSGALLLAPLWAAAAVALPWLVPGRALALRHRRRRDLGRRPGRRDGGDRRPRRPRRAARPGGRSGRRGRAGGSRWAGAEYSERRT